jgi:hypothetical protein
MAKIATIEPLQLCVLQEWMWGTFLFKKALHDIGPMVLNFGATKPTVFLVSRICVTAD